MSFYLGITTLTSMNKFITQIAAKQNRRLDNYSKGLMFEQYIVDLFNKHFFYLKQWRKSKKFTSTILSLDHSFPDLEMELVFTGKRKYRFAVECKWRSEFNDGKITWANDSQIHIYRKFQDQTRIPVFVAIGVGGEPSNPEMLFVT